jgi:hypothetical protein
VSVNADEHLLPGSVIVDAINGQDVLGINTAVVPCKSISTVLSADAFTTVLVRAGVYIRECSASGIVINRTMAITGDGLS